MRLLILNKLKKQWEFHSDLVIVFNISLADVYELPDVDLLALYDSVFELDC
jgi:hypothetical protein